MLALGGAAAVPGPGLGDALFVHPGALGHVVEKLPLRLEAVRLGEGRGRGRRRHRIHNGLGMRRRRRHLGNVVEVRAVEGVLLHPPVVHVLLEGRGAGAVGVVRLHLLNLEGHRLALGALVRAVHADDAHAVLRGVHRCRPAGPKGAHQAEELAT